MTYGDVRLVFLNFSIPRLRRLKKVNKGYYYNYSYMTSQKVENQHLYVKFDGEHDAVNIDQ